MTNWLKIRLVALMGGALLIGGAYLHAQDDYGPAAKTPEEAATNFYRLLSAFRQPRDYARSMDEQTSKNLIGSIERAQFEALQGAGSSSEKVSQLLAEQAFAAPLDAQVQSSGDGQTIVSVAPSTQPKSREVVVVQEDGGYRVDIVATYARWNNLSGLAADKDLYQKTGWISPLLGQQNEFMGSATTSQCQTNLKQIGLGILQYTQDYDEKMPPARKWREVLQPYVGRNPQIFSCPALGKGSNGYAENSKLSGISLARINSVSQTVQLYETSNRSETVFAPFTGRAYRHTKGGVKGMNIEFADGHVKWFSQGESARATIDPATTIAGFVTISTGATR